MGPNWTLRGDLRQLLEPKGKEQTSTLATLVGVTWFDPLFSLLQVDTGFYVWSFQGKPMYRSPAEIERFCQFLWRPRPPSLLTEEDIKVGC